MKLIITILCCVHLIAMADVTFTGCALSGVQSGSYLLAHSDVDDQTGQRYIYVSNDGRYVGAGGHRRAIIWDMLTPNNPAVHCNMDRSDLGGADDTVDSRTYAVWIADSTYAYCAIRQTDYDGAGATATITDGGGGTINVAYSISPSYPDYTMAAGDVIMLRQTNSYDGIYTVNSCNEATFNITAAYVDSDAGSWYVTKSGAVVIINHTDGSVAATVNYNEGCSDLKIVGDYCYVAVRTGGVGVIDITDPENPVKKTGYIDGDSVECMAIEVSSDGNTIYVPNYFHGLLTLDATDKADVTLQDSLSPPANGSYWDCVLDATGDYLYICGGGASEPSVEVLDTIDVSDPADISYVADSRVSITTVEADQTAMGDPPPLQISRSGNYLFLGNGSVGVEVIDVTTATAPSHIATLKVPEGYVWGAIQSGDYLYVSLYQLTTSDQDAHVLVYQWNWIADKLTSEHQTITLK